VTHLSSGSSIRTTSIIGLSAPPVRSSTSLEVVERVEVDVERFERFERSGREVTIQGQGELEPLRGCRSRKRSGRAL